MDGKNQIIIIPFLSRVWWVLLWGVYCATTRGRKRRLFTFFIFILPLLELNPSVSIVLIHFHRENGNKNLSLEKSSSIFATDEWIFLFIFEFKIELVLVFWIKWADSIVRIVFLFSFVQFFKSDFDFFFLCLQWIINFTWHPYRVDERVDQEKTTTIVTQYK